MERKYQKKNKLQNINFNFSDDDSEDDVFQSRLLKPVKIHKNSNRISPQNDHQKDTTIISGDCLRRQSQLPSFLEQDIGPPVMDSTHLVIPDLGNQPRELTEKSSTEHRNRMKEIFGKENINSLQRPKKSLFSDSCLDVDGRDENTKSLDLTPSLVEVRDCSIQTSILHHDNKSPSSAISKKDPHYTYNKTDTSIEAANISKPSAHNSSSSSDSQNNLFSTALEDVNENVTQFTKLNSHSSFTTNTAHSYPTDSYLSSPSSSSRESTSYCYVKDASLQTSLLHGASDKDSTNPPYSIKPFSSPFNHKELMDQKQSVDNCVKSRDIQKLPTIQGDYRKKGNVLEIFGSDSPNPESPKRVLAADSDEDLSPRKTSANNSKIIADSECDDEDCDSSEDVLTKNNEQENDVRVISPNNSLDNLRVIENNQSGKESQVSDLQDSGSLCLRWSVSQEDASKSSQVNGTLASEVDQVTANLEALSVHQGSSTSTSRRRVVSSSSDDDNFENFLSQLKVKENKKTNEIDGIPPMDDFIVDDDESLSEQDDDDSSNDDEDGQLFYLKTDNEINRGDSNSKGTRMRVEKTYVYHQSSSSDSSKSDSDLSDFIVPDDAEPQDTMSRSQVWNEEENEDVGEQVNLSNSSNSDEDIKSGNGVKVKSKDVSTPDVQNSTSITPSTRNKKTNGTENRPSRKKLLSSTMFTPAWSSDSDDDFLPIGKGSHQKTPSRFQLTSPGLATTFKTPKPASVSSRFETPVRTKGPLVHPWTAPSGPKRCSKSDHMQDDSTFFLKSLDESYTAHKRHPEAARYVKSFKSLREELTQKLFRLFNETVFDSKIPSSIRLEWNVRYRKTAGTFSYKRNNPEMAKITLSVKVCDRPERVRDTLVHELCHAAVRIINGVNESHGPVWKSWARKVNAAFPFMPVVARCHDYIIHSKYTYQCVNCKYRISRHSKSLDTEKKVCGHCKGEFQVFLTSELNASSSSTNSSATATPNTTRATPRTPNKFAMFVKECYSEVKKRNADFKHGDIMKELSREFADKNKIQS